MLLYTYIIIFVSWESGCWNCLRFTVLENKMCCGILENISPQLTTYCAFAFLSYFSRLVMDRSSSCLNISSVYTHTRGRLQLKQWRETGKITKQINVLQAVYLNITILISNTFIYSTFAKPYLGVLYAIIELICIVFYNTYLNSYS